MKKRNLMFVFVLALLIIPFVTPIDLTIEKQPSNEVMIVDLNQPAIINLRITNNGPSNSFLFYTFFGLGLEPSGRITINHGETKDVQLKIYPSSNTDLGYSTFDLVIQALDKSEISKQITVNVVNLEDAFEIGSQNIDPETKTMQVYLYNKIDYNFEDVNVNFKSSFFDFEEKVSLNYKEKKTFTVELNKDDFKELMAGFYTVTATINYNGITAEAQAPIEFVEKDILTSSKREYGFIIDKKIIEKTNEGNVIVTTETTIKKNVFSRLFTSFSPEPTSVTRQGGKIYYSWLQEIKPGETQQIIVRTNWIIPFLVIILIIVIVVFTKKSVNRYLVLKKHISFVRAKGGEFALKVTVNIHAKKYIEKVNVMERLPPLVKLYEKFLGNAPTKMDASKRLLQWNFDKLEKGESRVINYIIYSSKIGVLGRFALPPTTAIFEKDGKIKEVASNRAYFVAEAADMKDE
ncbi:MAG: hypothetical protein WC812_02155 [Candidatus Pacearchaeota archaeon]|jgi:hypothetical protein